MKIVNFFFAKLFHKGLAASEKQTDCCFDGFGIDHCLYFTNSFIGFLVLKLFYRSYNFNFFSKKILKLFNFRHPIWPPMKNLNFFFCSTLEENIS